MNCSLKTLCLSLALILGMMTHLPTWAGQTPEEAKKSLKMNHKTVSKSRFQLDRGLIAYANDLGPKFIERLCALRSGDTWVDLGAGNALALKQYLTQEKIKGLNLPPIAERAKVIAIGFERPLMSKIDPALKKVMRQRGVDIYRELVGDFKNTPISEFSGATLMTSNYGIPSYAEDVTYVFQKSLSGLKPGGSLFVHSTLSNFNFIYSKDLLSKLPNEEHLSAEFAAFKREFSDMKGVTVIGIDASNPYTGEVMLALERNSDDLEVANFKVQKFFASTPPYRDLVRQETSRLAELKAIFAAEEAAFLAQKQPNLIQSCAAELHYLLRNLVNSKPAINAELLLKREAYQIRRDPFFINRMVDKLDGL